MSNKALWITVGVIVLVLIVGGIIYETNKGSKSGSEMYSQTGSPTPTGVMASPTPSATPTAMKPTPVPSQTYLNLVKEFDAKGDRIQFISCHASPQSLSIRDGLQVMLDNRDDVAHTITFNKQTFKLAAYGYTVTSVKTLGDYNSTCDGNAAGVVTVEK